MVGSSSSDTSIISGRNPITYVASSPLTLFLVQAFIIIVFCRLIHLPLSLIRQPKVIGEVIGGIILGPTVFGRIPHFTNAIFPKASMPNINLVAQLGLIFFLFIVGMEVDIPYLRKHWKIATSVGVGSVALPFGLGYIVAIGLYNQFVDKNHISFGTFGLFIGIAISVTALPVLARILTELGMLHETSGIMVLAAGVSNDLVAWVLLALVISLAQAGAPIDTLYILLVTIGWFLLLAVIVRPLLYQFLKRTGSIDKGPSELAVIVVILLTFVSSFFTDIIGVHSIFGAFIAGAIIPRENNFPAKLTAKIEDLISAVFIPIYFALSGQNVDLSALNDGVTWGYTILIIVVAFVGKVVGAAVPARMLGLGNAQAIEVGILMSCKGLVELVILNVGLEAGILNTKIFSMFVLMAIVTTFATTPLTLLWKKYMVNGAKKATAPTDGSSKPDVPRGSNFKLRKIILAFDNVDMLTSNMVITQMLVNPQHLITVKPATDKTEDEKNTLSAISSQSTINHNYISSAINKDIFVSAVHLVDLTDRTADLIQAMAGDFIPGNDDPVMKVMNTFTSINRIPFEGAMSIAAHADRNRIILSLCEDSSDLLFISWDDFQGDIINSKRLFSKPISEFQAREGLPAIQAKFSLFSKLFTESKSHVCAFIDRGFTSISETSSSAKQVIVPFFGGNDDWLAFGIALYLAKNDHVRVTVLVSTPAGEALSGSESPPQTSSDLPPSPEFPARVASPSLFGFSRSILHKNGSAGVTETPLETTETSTQGISDQETIWEAISSVYDELSFELQASITLTKFSMSLGNGQPLPYTEALKLYHLQPHDLVLIGRSTNDTDNSLVLADPLSPSAGPAEQGSSSTAMVRPPTSQSWSSRNDSTDCLFGEVAKEIVTAQGLACSFIVCQAANSGAAAVETTEVSEVIEVAGAKAVPSSLG